MSKKSQKPQGSTVAGGGLQTKHIVLILGIVLIVSAAAVVVILMTRQGDDVPYDIPLMQTPAAAVPVIDADNFIQIQQDIEEQVARGMFETYMTTTWSFPDGRSASTNAVMGNSVNNTYPFWFTITLADSNEIIYTSTLLPVGTVMREIILDRELPAGTYNSTVHIHMVDENNEPIEGNMGIMVTLIIQS